MNTGKTHIKKGQHLSVKTEFKKGQITWNKGIPCADETKRKISAIKKGCIAWNKGEKASEEMRLFLSQLRVGKKPTEETKTKMSEAKKGKMPKNIKQIAGWNKGIKLNYPSPRKGKKHTEEAKKKLSLSLKGLLAGEKHPNWQGGITPENTKIRNGIEFRLWREAVFARDNWTCQKCKTKGGKLHSHHIRNFAIDKDLRFAIDNGVTLCKECHNIFHKKYGRKNNNIEQIKQFMEV